MPESQTPKLIVVENLSTEGARTIDCKSHEMHLPVVTRSKSYAGETVTEFMIVSEEDHLQQNAVFIPAPQWKDLRGITPAKLPKPVSKVYEVWEVVRASTDGRFLGTHFLGSMYSAVEIGVVLTNYVPLAFRDILDFVGGLFGGTPTPPPACPTSQTLTGSDRVYSDYLPNCNAANAAANALVQNQAQVDAGLALNGYACPNPKCQMKSLGPVTVAASPPNCSFSFIGSIGYLELRYQSSVDFTWSATVTCS